MELQAWNGLKAVIQQFLGSNKAFDYEQLVTDMLSAFQKLRCRMSVKMHFLHFTLITFQVTVRCLVRSKMNVFTWITGPSGKENHQGQ